MIEMKDITNNENLKSIFSGTIIENDHIEYYKIVEDIITSDAVLSMKDFTQHGSTTCYQHCINVSYNSYKLAKKLNFDARSTARAGLLHDLFLYDWHKVPVRQPLFKKHGFTHSTTALKNASKNFELNRIEKDIIEKHMWPLTFLKVPKYRESFLVMIVDKYCSTMETFEPLAKYSEAKSKKEIL